VVRIPLGKLRLGFSDLTIMDALSWMIAGDKSKRETIERAFNVRADIGQITKIIKEKGLNGLRGIRVSLGVPIMPALCQRLPTAEEMIEKMGKVAGEPKFDGTRLQIHLSRKREWEAKEDQLAFAESDSAFDFRPKGFVRTFTRNLENTTHMFPDLVQAVFEEVKVMEAILDCEAISFDPKTGKFLPFQETIKRKRKYEIGEMASKIPLKLFCFDILYKDGVDLLKTPFNERRRILEKVLSHKNKKIILTPQIVTSDPDELRKYHAEQRGKGLEGVVVKKWQEPYDPGRRGFTWVKFKEEETKKGGGLADTLECVVMGYYKGRGKRAGFGIGAFLAGIKEHEDSDIFLSISKIGTGLTDEQWREMNRRCEEVRMKDMPKQYRVDKNLTPDVWCYPKIVVEIQADNITKSPVHTAGLALRFPRLVRFRDLKAPEEATTLGEARKLYRMQNIF
jgi:DNA ligase-1